MTNRDLDRLHILKKQAKELTQIDASRMLDISGRQVRRLIARLKDEGPSGIVSRLLGKPGNRCMNLDLKQRVVAMLREKYEGFGPTLASEKLLELDGLKVSIETIRQWMIHNTPVISVEDYLTSTHTDMRTRKTRALELPKSNVYAFHLNDGSKVVARPSGTEPKIKLYGGVSRPSLSTSHDQVIAQGDTLVSELLDSVAKLLAVKA